MNNTEDCFDSFLVDFSSCTKNRMICSIYVSIYSRYFFTLVSFLTAMCFYIQLYWPVIFYHADNNDAPRGGRGGYGRPDTTTATPTAFGLIGPAFITQLPAQDKWLELQWEAENVVGKCPRRIISGSLQQFCFFFFTVSMGRYWFTVVNHHVWVCCGDWIFPSDWQIVCHSMCPGSFKDTQRCWTGQYDPALVHWEACLDCRSGLTVTVV